MAEAAEDTSERLQREERRRNRLAARRRNWFGWGNLHSVSATAEKRPLTRPMVRQRLNLSVAALAPVFFAAPLLALMIILFANLWPHTHHVVSDHVPLATAQAKNAPALAVAPASGKTTLLLLGTDQRQGDKGFRTDVIVLVSIDADNGQVGVVSFPRDMWVKVPALYEMKINSIMQLGGFDAMAGMFKANFGVKPDYYVLTNFEGFSRFVDLLKGIDVQVAQPLKDACDIPSLAVHGKCSVKPGSVWMEGTETLWYVRSRETTSDIDRLRRAQEVLVAIFKKMMTRNAILKIPQFESALKGNIETNMPFTKVLPLVPVADKVFNDTSLIKKFAITEDQSTPFTSWNGEWILLPDNQAIHDVLAQAGFFK
ncbi:MAG: LCP family protein [Anaerolineaceae bacterium]|jgi:LCP family protein required for cell wall assembly